MSARQKVKITGTVRLKTNNRNTKTKVKTSNNKKGNPNRCPACGRFI